MFLRNIYRTTRSTRLYVWWPRISKSEPTLRRKPQNVQMCTIFLRSQYYQTITGMLPSIPAFVFMSIPIVHHSLLSARFSLQYQRETRFVPDVHSKLGISFHCRAERNSLMNTVLRQFSSSRRLPSEPFPLSFVLMISHKLLDFAKGSICTPLPKPCNMHSHPSHDFTVPTALGALCESLAFHTPTAYFISKLRPQYTIVRHNLKNFSFIYHNLYCKV
jgi:hypothetical protein